MEYSLVGSSRRQSNMRMHKQLLCKVKMQAMDGAENCSFLSVSQVSPRRVPTCLKSEQVLTFSLCQGAEDTRKATGCHFGRDSFESYLFLLLGPSLRVMFSLPACELHSASSANRSGRRKQEFTSVQCCHWSCLSLTTIF